LIPDVSPASQQIIYPPSPSTTTTLSESEPVNVDHIFPSCHQDEDPLPVVPEHLSQPEPTIPKHCKRYPLNSLRKYEGYKNRLLDYEDQTNSYEFS
jgi:hypothetical protein